MAKKVDPKAVRFIEFGRKKFGSERGWKKRFADSLGVTAQTLQDYLTGRRFPGNEMQSKLRELGCNIEWLVTGDISEAMKAREELLPYGPLVMIPVLGRILATPEGKQYFEDLPGEMSIPYFKGNYFALIIDNDSLINAPEGDRSMELYPYDVCIFEKDRQPKNGDIVAVQMKQRNNRMVKVIKHVSKDEADLLSFNKFRNYPAVRIRKEDVAVWGVFVTKMQLSKAEKRKLGIKE